MPFPQEPELTGSNSLFGACKSYVSFAALPMREVDSGWFAPVFMGLPLALEVVMEEILHHLKKLPLLSIIYDGFYTSQGGAGFRPTFPFFMHYSC